MNKLVTWGWPVLVAVVAAVVAIFVSNMQTTNAFNAPPKGANQPGVAPLWAIQPGLGTVMIEYDARMGNVWWAANAGNWDMVSYQLKEMTEVQEVGETTRPGRADALKKFEEANLNPMIDAAKKKDLAAFTDAYDKAITGCNKCHGEQKDSSFPSYRFVKIMRPTDKSPFSNVDWAGAAGQ